jgi:hypothetical protein
MFRSVEGNDGQSHALEDHVIFTEKDLTMYECVAVCLADVLCQSVNYDPYSRACEMNNATKANASPNVWRVKPGNQYYENVAIMSSVYDP